MRDSQRAWSPAAPLLKLLPLGVATLLLAGCPDPDGPSGPATDITEPGLQISTPSASATLTSDSVTVEGTATDDVRVERLTYSLNGSGEQEVSITPGRSVSFRFSAPLQNGSNALSITAYDAAGNRGSRSLTFTGDACIPTLGAASAAPGGTLALRSVPATLTDSLLHAVIRGPERQTTIYALADREQDGEVLVQVPVHPTTPMAGGEIDLTLTAGETACRTLRVRIAALTPAPGTTEQMVNQLDLLLGRMSRMFGSNQEALRGTLNDLPPELVPLGVAQRLLDHPQNPNSLRALLSGTAPALGGQPVDLQVLDAMLASSGALIVLQEMIDSLTAATPPAQEAPVAPGVAARDIRTQGAMIPSQIRTAADLDFWMGRQANAAALTSQQAQRIAGLLSTALNGFALNPSTAPMASTAGAIMFVVQTFVDGFQALLPSELVRLDVDLTAAPTLLYEDDARIGRWSNARLTARGQQWRLNQPALLDGLLTGMGPFGSLINKLMKRSPTVRTAVQEALRNALEVIAGQLNTITGVEMQYDGLARVAGPFTYGPVDVTAARWTTAVTEPAGVIAIRPADRMAYGAVAPGRAALVIRTNRPNFADKTIQIRHEVEVQQMEVAIVPATRQTPPGEISSFTAVVRNATDQRVTWSASGGSMQQNGTWTAPAQPGSYTITATSVSRPQRRATAAVQVTPAPITVSVSPGSATLAPGAQRTFSATVEGTTNQAVQWSASAGTITQQGVFTAPQQIGVVTITARSAQDPSATGTATVQVQPPSPISIRIIPGSVMLAPEGQQQFVAVVEGTTNTAVEWRAIGYGSAINQNGLFRGPFIMGGSPTITITARSREDPTVTAQATVSFNPSPPVCTAPQYTFWNRQSGAWSPCGDWGI